MRRIIRGFTILVAMTLTVAPAHAIKLIILDYIAFEPQGQVNKPGNLVTLTVVAVGREVEEGALGDSVIYRVTATQPHSGASAVEETRLPMIPFDTSKPAQTQKLRPAPGSPRFEPGPIEVTAEATHYSKDGEIVRSWDWSMTVELVEH